MPIIELETFIKSQIEICFDLSRSIDLHRLSTTGTNEEAVEGCTSGLIKLGEQVTWRATHFGIRQKLTSKITAMEKPVHFRDEQQKGIFKFIIHDHYFEQKDGFILMKDVFFFESPFGPIGRLFDRIILTRYLTKFLLIRNEMIKEYAESEKWKAILKETNSR
jgi:ligand-binding SRPBCC domain-containing protein